VHFYHIWADTKRPDVIDEHLDLLLRHKLLGPVYIGLVGSLGAREGVRNRIFRKYRSTRLPITYCASQPEGYEQVTIRAMHKYCQEVVAPETPVLYTHAKGTFNSSAVQDTWRRTMDERLISAWPDIIHRDLREADAVGMYWRTDPSPHFSGNFWWTTAGYLSALPSVTDSTRYDAELWVGTGSPIVRDLAPPEL
jgi:hypothetical protein